MKKLVVIVLMGLSLNLSAQKLERVESIAKVKNEFAFYETQKGLWNKEIEKNNSNQEAWMNVYASARAMRSLSRIDGNTEKAEIYKTECQTIAKTALEKVPNTFAAYFINSAEKGLVGYEADLLKAAAIDDSDPRIVDELMIHYELKGDLAKKEYYANKLYELNELPSSILNWAYNLLSEVEPNAVVYTMGDFDTYALWIVQAAKNYRKDVLVVNYGLFDLDEYRNTLLKSVCDFDPNKRMDKVMTDEQYNTTKKQLLEQVFAGKNPVYISTTAYQAFESDYNSSLYLTGLSYKYAKKSFDNVAEIQKNYESKYLLDHLNENFSYHAAQEKCADFECMYLPSMLKLYQVYSKSGEVEQAKKWESIVQRIGVDCGQEELVKTCFENSSPAVQFQPIDLRIKKMEKSFLRVKDNMFMGENEVTNAEYNFFLVNLIRYKQETLYTTARCDSTQWVKKFPGSSNEPLQNLYHSSEAYSNYPVVNISYEGAKAYCEWLTQQYNQQKKRSHQKVVFRLPTKAEWLEMATAGNPTELNPFNQAGILNESGCYLGNIKTSPTTFFEDGGFHTVHVATYNCNKLGFWNTLGNVAEMTSEKGAALGGSWYNLYEECTFDKTQNYSGADPGVGFRVVMEIIEF